MTIELELPPGIEKHLESEWNGQIPRKILEAIAVEGYRQEVLSHAQVAQLLDLNRWETDAFLKERGAYLHYDSDDYRNDQSQLDGLLKE